MTINEMKERKRELGYSNARLAELSGVPETTLQKVLSGKTSSPRYDTVRALERVLCKEESAGSCMKESSAEYASSVPILPPYTRQGTYTIADREAVPEELRTELIDGVLYDMTSPSPFHQMIAGSAYRQIAAFIEGKGGDCIPFMAPLDVQLDQDDRTVVQPDVMIICDPGLITKKNIFGSPQFVLEVVSPSTGKRDYTKKLAKYENAGVKEYWIVDPYKKIVLVYFFEDDTRCPAIYAIDRKIPVGIYGGELEIDFANVLKWIPQD